VGSVGGLIESIYDTAKHQTQAAYGPTYIYNPVGLKRLSQSITVDLASESQTLAVQTYFVIWHARDIGVIGIS